MRLDTYVVFICLRFLREHLITLRNVIFPLRLSLTLISAILMFLFAILEMKKMKNEKKERRKGRLYILFPAIVLTLISIILSIWNISISGELNKISTMTTFLIFID